MNQFSGPKVVILMNLIFLGVWAIPGYSFKGIHKELRKMKGPGIHSYVRGTRIIQGLREYDASNMEERETILKRWEHLNAQLKN